MKQSALALAVNSFLGDKESTMTIVVDTVEFALTQVLCHGNSTALTDGIKAAQGKAAKNRALLAAFGVIPSGLKKSKESAEAIRSQVENLGADFLAALLANLPAKAVKSDDEKAKAEAVKVAKDTAAAIVTAETMGYILADSVPTYTVDSEINQMTKADLERVILLAQQNLAVWMDMEYTAAANVAKVDAAKVSAKAKAKALDAIAAASNASNMAKPAIVESTTALV